MTSVGASCPFQLIFKIAGEKYAFHRMRFCASKSAMSFLTRLLLALCVIAGMANGMLHMGTHEAHDACESQHSHEHGHTQDSHEEGDGKDAPHHHHCCHFPSAVCALDVISTMTTFQPILVEIPTDVSLIPEEPVFALDKPPLI